MHGVRVQNHALAAGEKRTDQRKKKKTDSFGTMDFYFVRNKYRKPKAQKDKTGRRRGEDEEENVELDADGGRIKIT